MKFKKWLISLFSVVFIASATACEEKAKYSVEYNFSVNTASQEMELGETFQVIAVYGDRAVHFNCAETNVATVSENGLVKAVGFGVAYVKMTVEGVSNFERICKISVLNNQYGVAFVMENNYAVAVNAERKLKVQTYKNGEPYDGTVTWSVNETTATITAEGNEAVFSASIAGEYTVTVTSDKGASQTLVVTVVDGFNG